MRPVILAIILAVLSSFAPAHAVGNITVNLGGVAFSNESEDVVRTSSPAVLSVSDSFRYKISGNLTATEDLVSTIPTPTPIGTFLDRLEPGFSSQLSGTFSNPSGRFPVTIINKRFDKAFQVNFLTRRRFAFDFIAEVDAAGVVRFAIKDPIVTSNNFRVPGQIIFEPNASFAISVPPVVECKVATTTVDEDFAFFQFTVVRTVNSGGPASVAYSTGGGTAIPGGHYTKKSGRISFASGEVEKSVLIPIISNTTTGSNKDFTVTIQSPGDGAKLGPVTSTFVTILNNDFGLAPTVEFGEASFSGDEGGTAFVELIRSGDVTSPISISVNTSAGSALAGRHFKALTQVVNFAQGQGTKLVSVKLLDNGTVAPSPLLFYCNLLLPGIDVLIGDQVQTIVNILEDDFAVPSSQKGPYVALVEPPAFSVEGAGFVSVSVSPLGLYTAKLKFGGKNYTVRGKFGVGGVADRVQFSRAPNRFLDLSIDLAGEGSISGSVRDANGELATISAARTPFSAATPFAALGKYPFALVPPTADSADQPTGYGFGYATLGKTGKVKIVGKLADNTPFSCGTLLFDEGGSQSALVYAALYKTYGVISGSFVFNDASAVTAALKWEKNSNPKPDKIYPSGFDIDLAAVGSQPTLPEDGNLLPLGSSSLLLSGGNLGSDLDLSVTIADRNKVTADEPNSASMKLAVNSRTRLFSGKFKSGDTTLKFKGIVLPDSTAGFGFFIGKPPVGTPIETGSVQLGGL